MKQNRLSLPHCLLQQAVINKQTTTKHYLQARYHYRYCLIILSICSLLFGIAPICQAADKQQAEVNVYEIKAVYLYNFLRFVRWPEKTDPLMAEKIKDIVVIGDSHIKPSLRALQAVLLTTQDKKLTIDFYDSYKNEINIANYRLLFITESEINNIKQILAGVAAKPVLTVADAKEFFDSGVMIVLLPHNGTIRYGVNRSAVRAAGLRLHSRLLAMAIKIIE